MPNLPSALTDPDEFVRVKKIDRAKLITALESADNALADFYIAIQSVERELTYETEDLDITSFDMVGMTADHLIDLAMAFDRRCAQSVAADLSLTDSMEDD